MSVTSSARTPLRLAARWAMGDQEGRDGVVATIEQTAEEDRCLLIGRIMAELDIMKMPAASAAFRQLIVNRAMVRSDPPQT